MCLTGMLGNRKKVPRDRQPGDGLSTMGEWEGARHHPIIDGLLLCLCKIFTASCWLQLWKFRCKKFVEVISIP